ncbi:uncharacterized protein [Prorops nasuta]|uniref:uncharacterized protein n=1 Tax=Prorops nasuta TaxID=863751 RepID=UPI0034CD5A0B
MSKFVSFAYCPSNFSRGVRSAKSVAQYLRLSRQRVQVPIMGVGASKGITARFCVTIRLRSDTDADFETDLNALVLPRPTGRIPSNALTDSDVSSFKILQWADPSFHEPGEIDAILGVDAYALVLRPGLRNIDPHNVIAQNTVFGWIFSGRVQGNSLRKKEVIRIPRIAAHSSAKEDITEILKRFWTVEEVSDSTQRLSPDDELCERLFASTHFRNMQGRYVVRIPLRTELPSIAESTRRLALNSFMSLTRRFDRDPDLAREYKTFMKEYESLGHMNLIPEDEIDSNRAFYLPHHAVMQQGVVRP